MFKDPKLLTTRAALSSRRNRELQGTGTDS